MGYSLWGCKESDRTDRLHFHFLSFTEGLQWRSGGYNTTLPIQGPWIPSLVGELRSSMLQVSEGRSGARRRKGEGGQGVQGEEAACE